MAEEWFEELKAAISEDGRPFREISAAANLGANYVQQMIKKDQPPKLATLDQLLEALGPTASRRVRISLPAGEVPLKGYVGAGGEVLAEGFGGDETVEAPAERNAATVAARVRGTSMYPTFHDGWLIYWSRQMAPGDLLNRIVVVQLEDDRIMVKTIMRGSTDLLWNLVSVNPDVAPMIDQTVRWAAPIDWIKPR